MIKNIYLFKKYIIFISFLFIFLIAHINHVSAASLQFDPTTANLPINQNLEVKVIVDAGTDEITSTDAYVLYDSDLLEVVEVRNGPFFPTVTHDYSQTGKIYIAGMVEDPTSFKTGKDTLATIVFKGKNNGQVNLSFDCTEGSTTDSNITKKDINAPDIIQCQLNNQATISVGSNNNSRSQGGTNQLPESGIFDQMKNFSLLGFIFLLIGTTSKLLLK